MKIAHNLNGRPITASPHAPHKAKCPCCTGVVVLRQRQLMDGSSVYFWRHMRNQNRTCTARVRMFR